LENLQEIWAKTLELLQDWIPSSNNFSNFIAPIIPYEIDIYRGDFIARVKETQLKQSILNRYMGLIEDALKQITGEKLRLVMLSDDELDSARTAAGKKTAMFNNLNPRYVFDSFVVGNSNQFAHAAALAVAKNPAGAYNPLFLYSSVGLGKTHLMHSIAHYILEHNPYAKVLYTSSEAFTNELINSIRDHRNEEFRNKYRKIDVLLIDDIQFIAQKDMTQEEFFHTFNTLYESNKQIIISSDRPPRDINPLEERLKSRFEWGLLADIGKPDFETRIAILRKKANTEGIDVSDEVTEYIARTVESNIRELEGALTRTIAYASLTGAKLDLALAEKALMDISRGNRTVPISPDLILNLVAKYYSLNPNDLRGQKKSKNIAYPRQIAMFLTRKHTDASLPKIGEVFGGRDHTTVIHACKKIEADLLKDPMLQKDVEALEKRISDA